MNLTEEQQTAINHQLAHARIVAVAGAGKTATLTHYIARRLQGMESPSGSRATHPGSQAMLVLMYNRAAQETFRLRLHRLNPDYAALAQVRTFHALGLSIYKTMMTEGWLPPKKLQPLSDMAIELQLKQLLLANSKAVALVEGPEQMQEWVDLCRQFIILVKSDILTARQVLEKRGPNRGDDVLLEIFAAFEHWRQQQQTITYDDMLYDPARVFAADPECRQRFADNFDEILVDEYQDINPIQHYLLQVIAGKRAQVMVIGDPDQTIYEFRGSSPQFITDYFARDFAAPTTYCLTRTFRFGHALALSANQLISNNRVREPILTVSADSTPQTKIHLAECANHGFKIAEAIRQMRSKGGAYNGMAVLCRLWSYARPVELELMAKGIPYRIEGEQSILQCGEIRPFLHALDLISGAFFAYEEDHKAHALFDLVTLPPLKIAHALLRQICTQWAKTIAPNRLQKSFLQALPNNLTPYQRRTLETFADALALLTDKRPAAVALNHYATALEIPRRLREGALSPEKGEEQARTVTAFLQFLTAAPAQTAVAMRELLQMMQNNQQPTAMDAVTLTTIHRSKGLEWPVVFLPNIAEGHLPCTPTGQRSPEQNPTESERRLMYVAITRAQKQLFITVPTAACSARVSRFIEEMNIPIAQELGAAISLNESRVTLPEAPSAIAKEYLKAVGRSVEVDIQLPSPNQFHIGNGTSWAVGDRVEHAILGLGRIQKLDHERVHILFDDGKTRAFISDLARPHLSLATSD